MRTLENLLKKRQKELQQVINNPNFDTEPVPGDSDFYQPRASDFLLRSWQVNPEPGDYVWTITNHFEVERILFEPKFRQSFQAYRCFDIFLSPEHAAEARDAVLALLRKKQDEFYGVVKQIDLFDGKTMELVHT